MGAKDVGARRPDRRLRLQAITILVTAVTVAIAMHAVAAIGAIPSDGRFTACYQTSDNVLNRVLVLAEPGEQCPASYARVSWPAQPTGEAAGSPGPSGPPGPPGPPGPRGAPGVSRLGQVRVVSRTMELSSNRQVAVRCRSRESAIGGGYRVHYSGTTRTDVALGSYPYVVKGRAVGWAFEPERIAKVIGRTTLLILSKRFYITRQQRHNHELFYRGGDNDQIAFIGHVPSLDEFPLIVDLHALCALR